MAHQRAQTALIVGFTAVFVGYLSVWVVGPGAGLSFLGIELGEWLKFLGIGSRRDLFYLPPITLGLLLSLWTVTWPYNARRAWAVRGLALLVSLLAFPALADISGPARAQYVMRVVWIGIVALAALGSGLVQLGPRSRRLAWGAMAGIALIGLLLPTWGFMTIRPFLSQVMDVSIGAGWGVWFNGAGHLIILIISIWSLQRATPSSLKFQALDRKA